MKCLELSLHEPHTNLALDEALLEECQAREGEEVLRFWESARYFVVMGAGGVLGEEVNLPVCREDKLPVLRRSSGGGTVLQGPGCLNYALVLDRKLRGEIDTITGTNGYVLGRMCRALNAIHPGVAPQGTSDLAIDGMKISGNAQRRKARYVLFHGTVLYAFDLGMVTRYLREPQRRPEYRSRRTHAQFVRNFPAERAQIVEAIRQEWRCAGERADWPEAATESAAAKRGYVLAPGTPSSAGLDRRD